jgi:hypothetical protein
MGNEFIQQLLQDVLLTTVLIKLFVNKTDKFIHTHYIPVISFLSSYLLSKSNIRELFLCFLLLL